MTKSFSVLIHLIKEQIASPLGVILLYSEQMLVAAGGHNEAYALGGVGCWIFTVSEVGSK